MALSHSKYVLILCLISSLTATMTATCAEPEAIDPKQIKVMPDWKIEVVAKAPQIHYPSVICTSPDGRIFFGEDPMDMPGPANKPLDRVICLHPDGHTTVFAEGLFAVFGIQYIDGKVYVHHCPTVSVFRDEDGVGKDRVDLIDSDNATPWGGTNLNDHIPSNFRLGMDGFLYMSLGDKGIFGAISNVDKRKAEIHGGGILRFRPDGTDMEVYSTGTRNHLDLSINPEDEIFTYDNTDDGNGWWTRFTHMVDGGYYGYPFDYRPLDSDVDAVTKYRAEKGANPYRPFTLWRMAEYGGGSPCGGMAYNEDALPEEYVGNAIQCEWGKSQIERFQLERDGGTYKILKHEELAKKTANPEMRPLGICVTPDGTGFYIADWNYGGWKNKQDAGRILKLSYTGKSLASPKPSWFLPAAMGKKFDATTKELVDALSHRAQSVRLVAQRRIAERGAEAIPLLIAVLNDTNAPAHARWSAIWTLDRLENGQAGRDAILAVLKSDKTDLSVRMQAARQLGTRKAKEAVSALTPLLSHVDAAMRFRAATALGRIGEPEAVPSLIEKLNEKDFYAHFAIFKALQRIGTANPGAWDAIVKAFNSTDAAVRDGAVCAMHDSYDEALIKSLSTYVTDAKNAPEGRASALAALAPLYKMQKPWTGKWWGTQPFKSTPAPKEMEWTGTVPATNAIKAGLTDPSSVVRQAAVAALEVAPDPSASDALGNMFKTDTDVATRKLILKALAAAKADSSAPLIISVLKDPAANGPLLADAINAGRRLGGDEMGKAIAGVARADVSSEILLVAFDAVGKMRENSAVPALAKHLSNADDKIADAAATALSSISGDDSVNALIGALKDKRGSIRRAAATALEKLRSPLCIEPLMEAVKDKEVQKEAIGALAAMHDVRAIDVYVDGLGSKDAALKEKCRKAISNIHEKALPLIEKRQQTNPLPAGVIAELQTLYKPYQEANHSSLFKVDTKNLSPEAYSEFAKSHTGNAENGKKLFTAENGVGCIKCHKLGNEGGDVGPSLSGVGAKYDRSILIESVLYPSKQILDGYQQTIIKTKTKQILSGIVRGETDSEITLVDSTGQKNVIKKADIETRKMSEISLMPEGLHINLKPEEFSDLITFLETLKEKPAEPAKK